MGTQVTHIGDFRVLKPVRTTCLQVGGKVHRLKGDGVDLDGVTIGIVIKTPSLNCAELWIVNRTMRTVQDYCFANNPWADWGRANEHGESLERWPAASSNQGEPCWAERDCRRKKKTKQNRALHAERAGYCKTKWTAEPTTASESLAVCWFLLSSSSGELAWAFCLYMKQIYKKSPWPFLVLLPL